MELGPPFLGSSFLLLDRISGENTTCVCAENRGEPKAPLWGQQLFQLMAELYISVNFSVITRVGDYGSFLGRNILKPICVFSINTHLMNSLVPVYVHRVALVNCHSLRPR